MQARYRGPLAPVVQACAELTFAPLPVLLDEPPADSPGTRWWRLDHLVDDGMIGPAFDAFRELRGPQQISAAAVHFLKSLARELIFLAAAGTYLSERSAELRPDVVWLPADERNLLGEVHVVSPRVAVRDAHAEPGTVPVSDEHELDEWTSVLMLNLFGPVIDALSAHTRVGRRTLWGYVVDMLNFYMLNPARKRGDDLDKAWRRSERLTTALLAAGAPIRTGPRLFWFEPERPRGAWAVRGTCCLDFRADPEHGYCITCPLEDDTVRRTKFAEAFSD
ncbi:(2Fe-2S)-binding protein [Prauserella cavernicola]|uniref:(2Fe-2S)-binding protein n=1 Tax=Prauserella cavernicola TaxID=2800127 RepID=A0A934V6N3_9PSEU|nr:(2Fe-2S)-binding protein [Prauserella cavernicola]MBK1787722.1 (2Fe-2S)-binding protein [Prauserella cavernicola]